MNKVVAGSVLGVGGAGTGITVAYSTGAFGGHNADTSSAYVPVFEGESGSHDYENWKVANNLSSFVGLDVPDCIKKIFVGIEDPLNKATGYSTSANTDVKISFSSDKTSNGCLAVNWNREEDKDNKYTGDFTLLWSFAQEDKGFIAYANVNFKYRVNNKAKVQGLVYVLAKGTEDENPWKITSKYEMKEKEGSEENNLPKPGDALSEIKGTNFLGMKVEGENTGNLVADEDINAGSQSKSGGSYWKWVGSKDGNKQITDFSSNLNTWWSDLFGESKNNIPNAVQGIAGSWQKILVVNDTNNLPTETQ